jgi:hypothetical protein
LPRKPRSAPGHIALRFERVVGHRPDSARDPLQEIAAGQVRARFDCRFDIEHSSRIFAPLGVSTKAGELQTDVSLDEACITRA